MDNISFMTDFGRLPKDLKGFNLYGAVQYFTLPLNPGEKIDFNFKFTGTREFEIGIYLNNTRILYRSNKIEGSTVPDTTGLNTGSPLTYIAAGIYKEQMGGNHPWLLANCILRESSGKTFTIGFDDAYDNLPSYDDAFLMVEYV